MPSSRFLGATHIPVALAVLLVAYLPAMANGGFVCLEGGAFTMGSNKHIREEETERRVSVEPFLIKATEVTNGEFSAFVAATGCVTTADKDLDPAANPNLSENLLVAGSMVFAEPAGAVDMADFRDWWRSVAGANWRRPEGPGSSIEGLEDHPMVQVSSEDARTYARWKGERLPTAAERKFAARGGLESAEYTWEEGYDPPNVYRLFDMAGNVWEHVSDWWVPGHPGKAQTDPNGSPESLATHFAYPSDGAMHLVKGGSWLCSPSFCLRYQPVARQKAERSLGTNHVEFRIAKAIDGRRVREQR